MPTRPWVPPAAFNFVATLIMFGAAIGLAWMAWNYYEYAPWTRDGRVRVYTIQLAPEVSGTVVSLPIKDTQFVHKGDVLFQIDPRDYQNKLKEATGRVAQTKAQADYLGAEATRRSQLSDLAVSAEQRQNAIGIAQAANAAMQEANGALDQARLDLERTTVRSPVNGWISDLILQQGGFAKAGQPAVTVVNADSFYVVGYFEETQLPRIRFGDSAQMVLMGYPDRPARGHVAGFGHGISVADAAPGVQGLPSVNPVFTWVRLAQRIPIRVELDDVPCPIMLSAGMTATVSIQGGKAGQADVHRQSSARRGSDAAQTCEQTGRN
ncbi:efflux RND transporter periplasmic adaptor subunit [Bradyrhizobium erythrophlei]|uniref:RND family efflux transporter, MFP subunit n=1 Tax=Bradyrhizobium erythrophlei TaxID=1437360 RepID=A0A1M5MJQ5_9BRAD|nr:HlyD family secretion protein [Bradyrhizobium erythrophlei]SHG77590.1 RND family efflux transporter, MFP subunit [Bradyrhizobium erythrophlei]